MSAATSPTHGSAPQPRPEQPTILVKRALGLGDFLTSLPAMRALARSHPEHRFFLAASPGHAELMKLAGLDWTIVPTEPLAVPPWPYASPPDIAVNLHGSGPESIEALRALRPGRIWTYAHPDVPAVPGPQWINGLHDTDIWCRLLRHFGVTADPTDVRMDPPPGAPRHSGAVVVHPGAAFAARRWPELRYAEVARRLLAQGHRILITGSAAERPLAMRIARVAGISRRNVLAGDTSPTELAGIIAGASLVICGDTGVGHLATSYATPSVLLFGPVSPALWGPRIDGLRHICLWAGYSGDPRGDRPAPGLMRITTHDVLGAAEQLLTRTRDPHLPVPRQHERSGTAAGHTVERPEPESRPAPAEHEKAEMISARGFIGPRIR